MRGGALPLLAWAALLSLFGVVYAIWDGRWTGVGEYAYAVLAIVGAAGLLLLRGGSEARRPGPPELPRDARARLAATPELSIGGAVIATGAAMMVFSLVFGGFLLYVGGGVLALGVGRTVAEEAGQRRFRRRLREADRSP